MRLLFITQVVDLDSASLSFTHRWLAEFSKHYESIEVICLAEGRHELPANVHMHSLGKESGVSRIRYLLRLYRYIWTLRKKYDAVFVHMNPEYVVLGAVPWRLLGKRVFMWRNHWAPGIIVDVAVALADKTFCTSKYSHIAKFKKNMLMPIGIDTEAFQREPHTKRDDKAILSLGRIAPSKNIGVIIAAVDILERRGVEAHASIYGPHVPQDDGYYQQILASVQEMQLAERIEFHPGVPNTETPHLYNTHGIFVNCSKSGMYDKTIFEAMACGCLVLASSRDLAQTIDKRFIFKENDPGDCADKLEGLLALSSHERAAAVAGLHEVAQRNSLQTLADRLEAEMK